MGYEATNNFFETAGKDYDKTLNEWKSQVEEDVETEKSIMSNLENAVKKGGEDFALAQDIEVKLKDHRSVMHPGYTYTSDNVDMKVLPRQMTLKNKNKDHHMFQMVCYKTRISPNHLPNDHQTQDINQVPFTSFLPSPQEQNQLVDEFIVLVGNLWAHYIPSLQRFADFLPKRIARSEVENTSKKTEKVFSIDGQQLGTVIHWFLTSGKHIAFSSQRLVEGFVQIFYIIFFSAKD